MKTTLLTIVISLFLIGSVKTQTHPITIHANQRVVSLQMTTSEYNSWLNDANSIYSSTGPLIRDIYQKFEDKFDFIFLILNETTIPSNYNAAGTHMSTSNATAGIGLPLNNYDAAYCSAGKLKAIIALNCKDYLENGPSLHELAHSWANNVIPTKDWDGSSEVDAMPHWGFIGGNTKGQLGGFQQSTLQTNIGGNPNKYRVGEFGGYANGGNSIPYSDLELYLMGMIPLIDVANFDVFSGLTQVTYGSSNIEFTASKRTTYDNAKILADAGSPRNPSSETSQKNFRLLVVIMTPRPLTTSEWTTIDEQSERFGRSSSNGISGYNFWEATRGLGTMETGNLLNAVRTSEIIAPTIMVSGSTTFCNGGSISLSTTSTEPLQWYKDGNPIEDATSQTYIATQSGSYSLKAGVGICSVESLSATLVTVTSDIPIPLITASGPTTFCQGGGVTLTASSAGLYSYKWSNGLTTQSISVNSSGNYSVQFTDNNGCTSFPSTSIPVLVGNLGTWTQKASFGGTARFRAVGFSIGSKVYLLTGYVNSYKRDFWEYDTSSDTWTQKTSFGGTARYGAVGFSIGTKGYVGTGYDGSYKKDFWEYDPGRDTWTRKTDFGGTARYEAVGFSIGTKGYVGTGNDGSCKDFWEYDPGRDTWTQKTDFGGTARSGAVGFSIGTKGYLGTGEGRGGLNKNDFWEYDPGRDTWTQKTDFGGTARSGAVGFSIGTKGYVGSGNDGSYKKDFWEYDPGSNTWIQKADFGGTARQKTVGFSIGTKGYVGTGEDGYYKNDFWEFNITSPTITASGATTFCKGGSVTLTSSTAISYLWSNNATTQSITVSTSGNYSVTINDGSGCLATSSTLPVVVNDTPAMPTVTLNGNALRSNASTGNQWYNQNGLVNGVTSQNYTPTTSGDYYVKVSANGCTSNSSNTMHFIPTGINTIEFAKSMKAYPNPVTNELTIELEGNTTKTNFEVLNSVGQVVFNGSLIEKTIVPTTSFTPGVYLIKLESGKSFEFKKIIKN